MKCAETILTEYFKIVDIIDSFDERLLAVKGWSVTFSLVMIGLGFEKNRRYLFLVAAISSICFFLLDVTYKKHQTNYYSRMNQIEVACSVKTDENKKIKDNEVLFPTPGINWSWWEANKGHKLSELKSKIDYEKPKTIWDAFGNTVIYLPHVFPFIFGILFFLVYPRISVNNVKQASKSRKADA